jgi:hypothetical protein
VALSLVAQRPVREADNLPPSNAEVKNVWSYTSTHPYVFTAWCLLSTGATLLYLQYFIAEVLITNVTNARAYCKFRAKGGVS